MPVTFFLLSLMLMLVLVAVFALRFCTGRRCMTDAALRLPRARASGGARTQERIVGWNAAVWGCAQDLAIEEIQPARIGVLRTSAASLQVLATVAD